MPHSFDVRKSILRHRVIYNEQIYSFISALSNMFIKGIFKVEQVKFKHQHF